MQREIRRITPFIHPINPMFHCPSFIPKGQRIKFDEIFFIFLTNRFLNGLVELE